jgi:hypothetical protein
MNNDQLLYWLTGVLGVPLINAAKSLFGLQGRAAMWLTVAVAALLGLAACLLERQVGAASLEPQSILAAFGQVLAAATLAYKLLAQ